MIRALMTDCINITDPMAPEVFASRLVFDPEFPLQFTFEFTNPDDSVVSWLVGRQLVVDGLEAVMLTGLGDFKCRSTAGRFVIRLDVPEGVWHLSLPREHVEFVVDEAERESPLGGYVLELDDAEIESWLRGDL